MDTKIAKLIEAERGWWLSGAGGWETREGDDQRVQSFSYARSVISGDLLYSITPIASNTVL